MSATNHASAAAGALATDAATRAGTGQSGIEFQREFLATVLQVAVCAGYQYYEFGQLTKALNDVTSRSSDPTSGLATSVQDGDRQLQCGTQGTPSIEDLVKRFRNTTSQGQTLESVQFNAAQAVQAAQQQTANIEQRMVALQNAETSTSPGVSGTSDLT